MSELIVDVVQVRVVQTDEGERFLECAIEGWTELMPDAYRADLLHQAADSVREAANRIGPNEGRADVLKLTPKD